MLPERKTAAIRDAGLLGNVQTYKFMPLKALDLVSATAHQVQGCSTASFVTRLAKRLANMPAAVEESSKAGVAVHFGTLEICEGNANMQHRGWS